MAFKTLRKNQRKGHCRPGNVANWGAVMFKERCLEQKHMGQVRAWPARSVLTGSWDRFLS